MYKISKDSQSTIPSYLLFKDFFNDSENDYLDFYTNDGYILIKKGSSPNNILLVSGVFISDINEFQIIEKDKYKLFVLVRDYCYNLYNKCKYDINFYSKLNN